MVKVRVRVCVHTQMAYQLAQEGLSYNPVEHLPLLSPDYS